MTPRPERPKLTAHRESIVPEMPAPGASAPQQASEAVPPSTATLSIRTDAAVIKDWHKTIRQLHASTGQQKGVIAAALLRTGLAAAKDIEAQLMIE